MKNSKTDRRQIPVTEDARPNDAAGDRAGAGRPGQ